MSAVVDAVAAARRELELEWAAEEEREVELTQAEKYARDPLGWINDHVWIASPFGGEATTRKLRPIRMQLFPDQEESIKGWIDLPQLVKTGELVFANEIIEKSRQIGETWAFAAAMAWAMHYHPVNGLAMHTVGRKIDDGGERNTVESLFGRVRYIDRRLDPSKIPGVAGKLVFRPFSRDPAKIENPANGAVWVGEGQTDNPGRGSTFDAILVDEAAFLEHGEKVYAALDEACPDGKALLSTVDGDANFHARLAKEKPKGYRYLRLHWSAHPIYRAGLHIAGVESSKQPTGEMRKNAKGCALCAGNRAKLRWESSDPRAHRYPGKLTSPWYDGRVIGKTDEQVANELDIDRERAKAGRVYPEFSSSVHVIAGGIPYDPELHHKTELAVDYGLDATSILVFQDAPAELRMIGILERGHLFGTSATPENVSAALVEYLRDLGVEERLLDPEWTRRMYAIGDPSGHNKTLETGKPFVAAYRRNGFVFGKPPDRLTRRITPSVTALKLLLEGVPKPLRVCGVRCEAFVEHVRENTWRVGPDGQLLGLNDDIHNHAMRAFAYYAVAKFPPVETGQQPGAVFDEPVEEPDPLARRRARRTDDFVSYGATG